MVLWSCMQTVSKTQLKSQLLSYFRTIEKTKKPLVVTHQGKPVLKVYPYKEKPEDILLKLKSSVVTFKDPTAPVGEKDWEAL